MQSGRGQGSSDQRTPKVGELNSCCQEYSWRNKRPGPGAYLCHRVGDSSVPQQGSLPPARVPPPAPSLSFSKTSSSPHVLLLSPSC